MKDNDERDLTTIPGWKHLLEKEKINKTEELTEMEKIKLLFSLVLTQQTIIDRLEANMVVVQSALNTALKGLDAEKITFEEANVLRALLDHRAFKEDEDF
jgi:hypothetical protein